MSKTRVVQVTHPGGPFELVEREILEPGAGHVRIKVDACGVCHSDAVTKAGMWPGIQYPRVPGHEIVGVVDAVGKSVIGWTQGQRVPPAPRSILRKSSLSACLPVYAL